MATLNPYLLFAGNTEEAFIFYKSVFGGEFQMLQRFGDTPYASEMSDEDKNKIMHVSLAIGKGNSLMATDALASRGDTVTEGNNFSLSLTPESKEEADALFNGLAQGGTIELPLADAFWGAYFGILRDKFNIRWMINYVTTPQS